MRGETKKTYAISPSEKIYMCFKTKGTKWIIISQHPPTVDLESLLKKKKTSQNLHGFEQIHRFSAVPQKPPTSAEVFASLLVGFLF